ncbi:ribonuclease P protein component [Tumebacillus sp. ITR2]|uniref:Ribonuclease P protein component n=1 Tax=Tumebacillus amylolyticus TaxID=2801339 RepID=A0ABS1J406_9BACL|nr:ribonuclease P protein component [Tumebacillus amylolyticus]MBL0385022.1 ribonuclease P protein component [Tumebacillus amylolyticus]
MLQREHRLTDKRDFQRVFHHGHSFANRYLVLYYMKTPNNPAFRVGFSVSKKVGKAVTRNRVKRLLREAFRLEKEKVTDLYDFVVIARPSAAELDFHTIRQNVQHLLRNMENGKDASQRKATSPGKKGTGAKRNPPAASKGVTPS